MLRKKAKGISIALVTIMALTSVNFGSLNEFSLFTENTAMAQEETRVLTEFEDPVFREALVDRYLDGDERTTLPENAAQLISDAGLGEDYEYPIFSTDIEELERIEEFYYDGLREENKIKSVKGIEYLKKLKKLFLFYNNLREIDISKNTELTSMDLTDNNLNEIDISKNTELTYLNLMENSLRTLDTSKNIKLETLYLNDNNLNEINISENAKLIELDLSSNNLSELDVSNNTLLDSLYFSGNYIKYLNLYFNNSLSEVDLSGKYREEIVDDKERFNLKEYISKAYENYHGEEISEDKLKSILEREDFVTGEGVEYDKNSGIVTLQEGNDTFTYNLDVPVGNEGDTVTMDVIVKLISKEKISILKDFEDSVFRREIIKYIGGKDRNTAPDDAEELIIASDLSDYNYPIFSSDELRILYLRKFSYSNPEDPIQSVKGIKYMKGLEDLYLNNNSIKYIDLFYNYELAGESMDLSNQHVEEKVSQMKTFNLKKYLQKAAKEYHGDDITEQDLNEILLRVKSVKGEGVESYDTDSGIITLKEGCDTFTYELEVPLQSNMDSAIMDVTVKLILKKENILEEFEDSVFRKILVEEYLGGTNRTTIPENADELLSNLGEDYEYPIFSTDIEKLESMEEFFYEGVDGKEKIKSVKGIEYLKKLKKLDLSSNNLSELDISKNTKLNELNLSSNNLEELDIKENTELTKLDLSSNKLSGLDISKNTKLNELNLSSNNLKELDTKENTELTKLDLSSNNLSELDISKNTKLNELNLSSNNLKELDTKENTELTKLDLSSNNLSELDISKNTKLTGLDLSSNNLSKLDTTANTELTDLDLSSNKLSELKISDNKSFNKLDCSNNHINYLNLYSDNGESEVNLENQYREEIVNNKKRFNLKKYISEAYENYHGKKISENDLKAILEREDFVKGDGVKSYNKNNGIVILKEGCDTFTYNLKVPVGNNGNIETMDVTLKLIKEKSSGGSSSKPIEEPEEKTPETEVQDKAFAEGYEDGTFKPDAPITRAEAAAMFARLLEGGDDNVKAIMPAEGFSDLSEGWYKKYMDYMVEKGIMRGYGDGTIKPDSPITRAEFSQMISSQIDNEGIEADFTDIENHWAKKAVEKAFEKNIVDGYPDKTFRPDNEITRAEAAKMLNRFAGRIVDAESIKSVENPEDLVKFTDVNEDHWGYYEVMEVANNHTRKRDEKTEKEKWIKIIK